MNEDATHFLACFGAVVLTIGLVWWHAYVLIKLDEISDTLEEIRDRESEEEDKP